MTEREHPLLSRRTVVGAVWATPVIVAAIAAPAAAASGEPATLTIQVSGPNADQGATSFVIRVLNLSTTPIAAGDLIAYLPYSAQYLFSGFSGDLGWNYGPDDPTFASRTFAYYGAIGADSAAGPLLLFLRKTNPNQTPPPVATLTFTAPGFTSATVGLPVLY